MQRWDFETLWEAVQPLLPGFTVEVLPSIDSTNSELMRRARVGQLDPILLVTEEQTAGRGRLGREWLSGGEEASVGAKIPSLTFSLGLPLNPVSWSGLSLAVGASVAHGLHPDLRLKWPNDVWLADRKLGGILIETASFGGARYLVIGIGINILARDGGGLSTPPAWLKEVHPDMDAPAALHRLLVPLVRDVLRFQADGFAPFQRRFATLDALAGRAVQLSDGTCGVAQGVDADGALVVQTPTGLKKITSAEVSVRPAVVNRSTPSNSC